MYKKLQLGLFRTSLGIQLIQDIAELLGRRRTLQFEAVETY